MFHGIRKFSTRLESHFGTEFWFSLQRRYELKVSRRDVLPQIEKTVRPFVAQCPAVS
jgi:plasmid maintenance system antidote protein VapI